jgi:hypothetical protein
MNTLTKLCRQNTGSHFLDSGDHYGRHWQRPLPDQVISIQADFERNELSATIHTALWLPEVFEVNKAKNRAFHRFAEKHPDLSWIDIVEMWAESLGLNCTCDNTYNHESDLDQCIIWYCLSAKDDWYYDSDAIWLVQSHNGCDVRGGYSDPVVVTPIGEGGHLSTVIGWYRCDGKAWPEVKTGYSSNPTYELGKQIARVIDVIDGEVEVETTDGEIVWIYPYFEQY